jgi:hypothetical protein
MGRKVAVAVGVMVASVGLALGVMLYVDRPSEIERLILESGKPAYKYIDLTRHGRPQGQNMYVTVTMPERPAGETPLFKELIRRGWKTTFSGHLKDYDWCNVYPPDLKVASPVVFMTYSDRCQAAYSRRATRAEQLVHRVKGFLNIAE